MRRRLEVVVSTWDQVGDDKKRENADAVDQAADELECLHDAAPFATNSRPMQSAGRPVKPQA